MSAIESVGSFTMPPLTGSLHGLWDVILDLADNLPLMSWELVGGQMVMAHGLAAGRPPTRPSQDIDVLGNLITSSKALRTAVAAVRDLGFEPEPSMDGKRLHRFVRTKDNQAIDILAPDHIPPAWKPTTVPPLQTIQIAGGNQDLQRLRVITVTKADRTTDVPVPSVLGSLILKAAAYRAWRRRERRLCHLATAHPREHVRLLIASIDLEPRTDADPAPGPAVEPEPFYQCMTTLAGPAVGMSNRGESLSAALAADTSRVTSLELAEAK